MNTCNCAAGCSFHWRGQPSTTAPMLAPSPMDRKVNLAPKRMHIYAKASAAVTAEDVQREARIAQINSEVERHFHLAQTVDDALLRGHHRDEARSLAAKVKALVALRPAEYVAHLEAQRGIS